MNFQTIQPFRIRVTITGDAQECIDTLLVVGFAPDPDAQAGEAYVLDRGGFAIPLSEWVAAHAEGAKFTDYTHTVAVPA